MIDEAQILIARGIVVLCGCIGIGFMIHGFTIVKLSIGGVRHK